MEVIKIFLVFGRWPPLVREGVNETELLSTIRFHFSLLLGVNRRLDTTESIICGFVQKFRDTPVDVLKEAIFWYSTPRVNTVESYTNAYLHIHNRVSIT